MNVLFASSNTRRIGCGAVLILSTTLSFAAGRQLTGVYAPTATPPLAPEEAAGKMTLPDGFEARIFAVEPQVVNPVAMTWDERGRLWVVELYEYPLGAAPGTKPRDNVKILEDTDNDGRADKVTVFADGLNLATGLLLGYGGAFVGQAPHLLFLEDTDGDDKADKRTILKTGFGLEDRHELLNGFTWGPDGYLYMTHGIFTHSKVKNPDDPNDDGVVVTAAVARYHPRTKKFEVFAEGTSNPWGVDFDRAGNAFVSACVIDHLFHMAPGGIYQRQAGTPPHPYAYELLPSIVDHKHFRAAYAGAQVYQGDQYPEEYKGTILMGNIHDSAIHQDKLTPNGSSFKASFMKDFVRSNDGWFRPVSTQIGPDGAVWIMDWYDKYPCYQNANADPEGVDRERGRIWRIVHTGNEKGKSVPSHPVGLNLAKNSTEDLVQTLAHANAWHRRMAQRILSERRDASARPSLLRTLNESRNPDARIAALWTLHTSGLLEMDVLEKLSSDSDPVIRTWVARLIGERPERSERVTAILDRLGGDESPAVRLAVATAVRQFISDHLTINSRDGVPDPDEISASALTGVFAHPQSATDPLIPFMLWMDSELWFAHVPGDILDWYADNGMRNSKLSAILLRKGMRRICDTGTPENIGLAVAFLDRLATEAAPLIVASLEGLIEGQKGRAFVPNAENARILAKLRAHSNADVANRAQQLGTIWGDAAALSASITTVQDAAKPENERIEAIQALRQQKSSAVREALLSVIRSKAPDPVLTAAITTLGSLDADELPDALLRGWKQLPTGPRNTAVQVLSSRNKWAQRLLSAIENKTVASGEISPTVVRSLVTSKDDYVRNRATKIIGKYRDTAADKAKVISEKRKVVLNGSIDLQKGREIAQKTCFTCHKFYNDSSAEVGPDLTGVGRPTLDALLANVIDPNQIIGVGYENVEVTTKDDRTISGRLVENTDSRVKLLTIGPKEEVIGKSDIANMRVSELSVMPEGLEQMPDEDFRNLIWYIYSPPQDKKPFSVEEERREILKGQTSAQTPIDGESVALWNPQWKITAPEFENSPVKLPAYHGRRNVLMTHPFDESKAASIERVIDLPAGKSSTLTIHAASHDEGNWELRVYSGDKLLMKQVIGHEGPRWQTVNVDLTAFAGTKIPVRLENKANGWHYEFGYWGEIEVTSADREQRAAK